MQVQVSRTLALVLGQLFLNVFLASWLIDEYVHNLFLQQYLSSFWATNTPMLSAALALGASATGGYYALVLRRRALTIDSHPASPAILASLSSQVTALDVCPICNALLKTLSENRFQCRKCRRYFKK